MGPREGARPDNGRPRISFGIIVLNGEPFTRYCLRSIYPFAHEIIAVEGAHTKAGPAATPDGHSVDGTLDALRAFKRDEDPEDKLQIVTRDGFWPDVDELTLGTGKTRTSQCRAYAERATGDYLWQIDIDEFYRPQDMRAVVSMLAADPSITAVSFPFLDFWARPGYAVGSWKYRRKGVAHRLFRWAPGYVYLSHNPPTVLDETGRDLRQIHAVAPAAMASRGVRMYHYSYLFPVQVVRKARMYEAERPDFWPRASAWASDAYLALNRPYRVDQHYWLPSWLERFDGDHPPEIERLMRDVESGIVAVELRRTDDIERLLSSWWYPRGASVLERLEPFDRAWSYARPRLVNLAHGRVPGKVREGVHRLVDRLPAGDS